MDHRKQIGTRIAELRQARRLTQYQLAQLVGMHYTFIWKVERGDSAISLETAQRLASALDFSLAEFDPKIFT